MSKALRMGGFAVGTRLAVEGWTVEGKGGRKENENPTRLDEFVQYSKRKSLKLGRKSAVFQQVRGRRKGKENSQKSARGRARLLVRGRRCTFPVGGRKKRGKGKIRRTPKT